MGGKMEGFWSVGVGVLLVIVAGLLGGVEGRASAHCVQVGQALRTLADWRTLNVTFSIGGKLMRPRYPEVLDSFPFSNIADDDKLKRFVNQDDKNFASQTCIDGAYKINAYHESGDYGSDEAKAGINHPRVDYCSPAMSIDVYAVQQFGVTLRGWLYVEVFYNGTNYKKWDAYYWKKKDQTANEPRPYLTPLNQLDQLEWVYVQVRDESFNAIGEFVSAEEFGEGNECGPFKDTELIYPSEYQIMPCSATGFREAKTGQAMFVAKKRQYQDETRKTEKTNNWSDEEIKRYLPKTDLKTGIRFIWRLNEYWCNRHEKIRIDVTAWSSKNEDTYFSSFDHKLGYAQCSEPDVAASVRGKDTVSDEFSSDWTATGVCRIMDKKSNWFLPKWFGAADIRTPGEPLNCEKKISGGLIPEHSRIWLHDTTYPVKVKEDFAAWDEAYLRVEDALPKEKIKIPGAIYKSLNLKNELIPAVKGCQVLPFVDKRIPGNEQGKNIRTFGGRCKGFVSKKTSNTQYQHCEYNNTLIKDKEKNPQYNFDYENWDTYKTYTETLTSGRKLACSVDCVELTVDDLGDLGNMPVPTSGGNGTTGKGVVINQYPVKGKVIVEARKISRETTFWQVRKYHGNLCIFFTMFIMPVCLFITRYYKETFMHGRCASCPPWLWIHLFMCISVLTLFRSTFSAMRETIYAWGRQVEGNSELHRALGYVFLGMFGLMTAIGGLRPIPRIPRLATCAMHSVVGFALYLIALGLIIHSPSIPGSPSVDYCIEEGANNSNRTDPSEITHRVTIYASVWLVLDIIFHAALTIFQVVIDKQTGIERPGFGLPFIPFLPPNANRDYQGALVRKIVLIVYVIASFIMTVVTMADIFDNDLDNPSGDHEFCKPWNVTTCNIKDNPFGCTPLQKQYYEIVINRYNITWDE